MNFGSVTGCCAAYNIYNLGYAHGHKRASTQEEFEYRFIGKPLTRLNFAITNSSQNVERKYLETMGFETSKEADGGIQMHIIAGSKLRSYIDKRRPELVEWKRKQEEKETAAKKSLFANPAVGEDLNTILQRIRNLPPVLLHPRGRNDAAGIEVFVGEVRRTAVVNILNGLTDFRHYNFQIRNELARRLNQAYDCRNITIYASDDVESVRRRVYRHVRNRRLTGRD